MKTWDLVRGLLSFSLTLTSPVSIKFSKCGLYYLIGYEKKIEIYTIEGVLKSTLESKSRINKFETCILSLGSVVVYGGEDKVIRIGDMNGKILIEKTTRHQLRIKDLNILHSSSKLVTCSSEGLILMWDLERLLKCEESEEYSYEAKCRLTCVGMVMAQKPRLVKISVIQSGGESEFEEERGERVTVTLE